MRRPRSYVVIFVVGTALVGLGVVAGLIQSLTAERRVPAVDLNDVVDGYLEEVDELLRRGEHARATEQLELVVKLLPHDRELAHDLLGRALTAQGRFDDAVGHFREAIRIDPDFAEAHHGLGLAYARQGRTDQALAALRQALRLRPDFPAALENLRRIESGSRRSSGPPGQSAELEQGRSVVRRFYRGELERIHSAASASFTERMSLEQLVAMQRTVDRQLGPETEVLGEQVVAVPGGRLYVRRARFERHDGDVEVLVQLDGGTRVGGLMFRPAEGPAP